MFWTSEAVSAAVRCQPGSCRHRVMRPGQTYGGGRGGGDSSPTERWRQAGRDKNDPDLKWQKREKSWNGGLLTDDERF